MLGSAALGQVPLGAVPTSPSAAANPPPFGNRGRGAIAASIVALWQPPDPQPHIGGWQPLAPRKLAPQLSAVEVDNPPFTVWSASQAGRALSAMLAQPDPWTYTFAGACQPHAPRRLSAGVPGQSIDRPPFVHPTRTRAAIAAAAAEAQPPVLVSPESYQFVGIRQPGMARQLSPAIPGQSADPPPFADPSLKSTQRVILAIAQPDPWTYTFNGGWQPFAPRKLSVGTPGQSIDNPPFFAKRKAAELGEIVVTWQPPPPQPWFPRYQIKFTASFTMIISIG